MSEQSKAAEPTPAQAGADAAQAQAGQRTISDPREVASLVMARMNLVNAKKDELARAIEGLVDITQQLTRTYGAQMVAMEHLRRRVKALEAQAGATTPPESVQ
jgi:hypothetical protein